MSIELLTQIGTSTNTHPQKGDVFGYQVLFLVENPRRVWDYEAFDVARREDLVYVLTGAEISILKQNNDEWDILRSIQLPSACGSFVLSSKFIYVGDDERHHIYKLDIDTRTLVATYGSEGSKKPEQLKNPFCADTDICDTLLICDRNNNSIKVMSHDGTFHVVSTDLQVRDPRGAVYHDGCLFVASLTEQKIYKFSFNV